VQSTASDIYSLGLILFELCTGSKVFDGLSEANIVVKIHDEELDFSQVSKRLYSEVLKEFIRKLSAVDVADRFKSAAEALKYLEASAKNTAVNQDGLLAKELEILKGTALDKTRTVLSATKPKKKNFKKYIGYALGVFAATSGVAALFLSKGRDKNLEIRVLIDGKSLELKQVSEGPDRIKVGGELGYYTHPLACESAAIKLLALPSLIFDVEVEKKLALFAMPHTPESFLAMQIQNFSNQEKAYQSLKKNCGYSKMFSLASKMYEDLREKVPQFANLKYSSFSNLRHQIEPNVLFSERKYNDLFPIEGNDEFAIERKRVQERVQLIKQFTVKSATGFNIFKFIF
jgi:serine/threonine protein kinase